MKILFHRPTPWRSPVKCSTKSLAEVFAHDGHEVIYLENLCDPIALRVPSARPPRLGLEQVSPRLRVLRSWTPVVHRDPWPLNTAPVRRMKYNLARPNLRACVLESEFGVPDMIWNTVPGAVSGLKHLFPEAMMCSHVVDYYPAFRGEWVKAAEREDYALSDHIFTIGDALRGYLVDELGMPPRKVVSLGQGVDVKCYTRDHEEPAELAGLSHPRLIWCGVLDKLDTRLALEIANSAAARGGVLVLLGPSRQPEALGDLLGHPATVWLGPVDNSELPAFLSHVDLGVMLYDRNRQDVYRGQNPLKLYEYAAAGLPILSTPHDEYSRLSPPVLIVESEKDVTGAVDAALGKRDELGAAARAFAEQHDWRTLYERIMAIVGGSHSSPAADVAVRSGALPSG